MVLLRRRHQLPVCRPVQRIEIEEIPDHDLRTHIAQRPCARSSSVRTIARTALPCFISSSVTVRPIAPTRPAAPVTRMGFAIFPPMCSLLLRAACCARVPLPGGPERTVVSRYKVRLDLWLRRHERHDVRDVERWPGKCGRRWIATRREVRPSRSHGCRECLLVEA